MKTLQVSGPLSSRTLQDRSSVGARFGGRVATRVATRHVGHGTRRHERSFTSGPHLALSMAVGSPPTSRRRRRWLAVNVAPRTEHQHNGSVTGLRSGETEEDNQRTRHGDPSARPPQPATARHCPAPMTIPQVSDLLSSGTLHDGSSVGAPIRRPVATRVATRHVDHGTPRHELFPNPGPAGRETRDVPDSAYRGPWPERLAATGGSGGDSAGGGRRGVG